MPTGAFYSGVPRTINRRWKPEYPPDPRDARIAELEAALDAMTVERDEALRRLDRPARLTSA